MCGQKPRTSVEASKAKTKERKRMKQKGCDHENADSRSKDAGVNDSLTEGMRRFAISLNLAKKRHEKDRKRVLGEQLDGYLTVEGSEEIFARKIIMHPSCSRLKTIVRRHIDEKMTTRNFRVRNDAVTKKSKR